MPRFEGVPVWQQLLREYETHTLQMACFRGVVSDRGTEASIVDGAWCIVDGAWCAVEGRYGTEEDAKAYARKMLKAAEEFLCMLNGTRMAMTHARKFETFLLTMACYRDKVCDTGKEASMVDAAWSAKDARYQTFDDVKAYAEETLDAAKTFHEQLHFEADTDWESEDA